jgi:tetratricopeptide (TPR) repeat protein
MSRLEKLLALVADSPADSFLTFALAKEYEGMGQLAEAGTYYQQLHDSEPHYVGLYYHWGKWFEATNSPDEARRVYALGIQIAREAGDRHAMSELQQAEDEL